MSKVSKGNKGEERVAEVLSAFEGEGVLLNDLTFVDRKNHMTHQCDHVLVHPHGVFLVETKNYSGKITVDEEGRWRTSIRSIIVRIHNPIHQNKGHAKVLRQIIGKDVDVVPVVVFVKNNAPYLPDETVIDLRDLPLFIESYPYSSLLSAEVIGAVVDLLLRNKVDVSRKEHVENIGYLKQARREKEAEMAYAIEQGMCPRCGSLIEEHNGNYRCPKCAFGFCLS